MTPLRRAADAEHPGSGDCEALRPGWLAQPANALSSLAYVIAGAGLAGWLRARGAFGPRAALFCGLVTANGAGGVAFHGPGDRASRWLHDAALVGTVAAMAVEGRDVPAPSTAVLVGAGAAVVAMHPDTTSAVAVAGGVLAGAGHTADAVRGRVDGGIAAAGLLLVAAAAVNVLSRTGGPCCRPSSRWQGHAAWHVLTAASLARWGAAAFGERGVVDGGRTPVR